MSESKPPAPTDFEAAAAVAAALKDLPKPRQELVMRWVAESLGIVPPQTAPPPPPVFNPIVPPTSPPPQAAVDIASFVKEKNPRTDIQFVTVVAFYYRFVAPELSRIATINAQVAQDATRLVNRDRLQSPKDTLNNAKRQGYLDSSAPGEFSINTVGENLVARTLPRTDDAAGNGGGRRTQKASKKTKNSTKK